MNTAPRRDACGSGGEGCELHAAVAQGDLQVVEELLASYQDSVLTRKDVNGRIALHQAILLGSDRMGGVEVCEAVVRLFLAKAEDWHWLVRDNKGRNALHMACVGYVPAVLEIVQERTPLEGLAAIDAFGYTPALAVTARHLSPAMAKSLSWAALTAPAPHNGQNGLMRAVSTFGDGILSHVLDLAPPGDDLSFQQSPNMTILHWYASSKDSSAEGMTMLLDRVPSSMVSATCRYGTPLHFCCHHGAAAMLLERMTVDELDLRDGGGNTALHISAFGEVSLLIAQRMRRESLGVVNDKNQTPLLCLLVGFGFDDGFDMEALIWLVRHMPEEALARADCDGDTVLFLAAAMRNHALLEALLDVLSEAALLALDKDGNNVLHACLMERGHFARRCFGVLKQTLELLLKRLPTAYRTMANEEGVTPADLAAKEDAKKGADELSHYFVSTAKGAVS